MTAILHTDPDSRPRDTSGKAMPYATLTFIRSGTEQVLAEYTADALGVFATISPDFETYTYRVQLRDRHGVLRYDVDPYLPDAGQTVYYDAQVQALSGGEIVPGAQLTFEEDGDEYDIYADHELKHVLPNPVTADASGLFPKIYFAADPAPCDPYFDDVAALLHFNGTNGSQVFVDEIGHTVSTGGGEIAVLSTARVKFGTASINWPSNSTNTNVRVLTAGDTRFNLGTRNFTIETWLWASSSASGNKTIFQLIDDAGKEPLGVDIDSANSLRLTVRDSANGGLLFADLTPSVPMDQWVHFMLTRSGSVFRMFVNGVVVYTGSSSGSIGPLNSTGRMTIGRYTDSNVNPWSYGNFYDFRVTIDRARYTADFDVPTAQFPDEQCP